MQLDIKSAKESYFWNTKLFLLVALISTSLRSSTRDF